MIDLMLSISLNLAKGEIVLVVLAVDDFIEDGGCCFLVSVGFSD